MSGGFLAIICFKYLKAAVFFLAGLAALHLARLSSMPTVEELAHFFRVAPEKEIIQQFAALIHEITPGRAIGFGVVSFFVAAIFAAEGTLLAFRVWWSTYFTIGLTALGIPLEIFEIFRRPASLRRYALLAINAVILAYLWRRRNEFRHAAGEAETKRG